MHEIRFSLGTTDGEFQLKLRRREGRVRRTLVEMDSEGRIACGVDLDPQTRYVILLLIVADIDSAVSHKSGKLVGTT